MKIAQVIAVLAFTASLCSARICQDGSHAGSNCDIQSVYNTCIDFCNHANPDQCGVEGTGCSVKSTCETSDGADTAYACCECGCRQGDGWCVHK